MSNFICLKGGTEFLCKHTNEKERLLVSELLIPKSYLFMHISETLQELSLAVSKVSI